MKLTNILLEADAVSTNAQALLKELENLTVHTKYAHLMQLTKAAEVAIKSLKEIITDAHQDVVTKAIAEGKDGGEFVADGLRFQITQKYQYNWAANDIQETYTKDDGSVAKRNKYANLLREQANLKEKLKLNTQQIELCKAEIKVAHPNMQKTNISYVVSYLGRKDVAS